MDIDINAVLALATVLIGGGGAAAGVFYERAKAALGKVVLVAELLVEVDEALEDDNISEDEFRRIYYACRKVVDTF